MVCSKKWSYFLCCCLLFFACKSTDCGCPMAETAITPTKEVQVQKNDQKEWTTIRKEK